MIHFISWKEKCNVVAFNTHPLLKSNQQVSALGSDLNSQSDPVS